MSPDPVVTEAATAALAADRYEFGPFELHPRRRALYRRGELVPVTKKVFDVLLVLVQEAGHLVTKETLLERVWTDSVVEEGSVANTISQLRKILNPEFPGDSPITTVARLGYRFTAAVRLRGPDVGVAVTTPAAASRRSRWWIAAGLAVVLIAAAAAAFLLPKPRAHPFEHVRQEIVFRDDRGLGTAAISPDGRFIVMIIQENAQFGLVLFNVATKSRVVLLEPSPLGLEDPQFTADGNSIVFSRRSSTAGEGIALYELPILGGDPVKIADAANSGATFAPDGKTFAFVRWYRPTARQAQLVIGNLDRRPERVLMTIANYFPSYPTWSPDGKVILLTRPEAADSGVDVVDVATRQLRRWYNAGQAIRSPVWMPDGSGILCRFNDPDRNRRSIGFISYPGAEFRRITSDTNDYRGTFSLTSDAKALLVNISRRSDAITVVALGDGVTTNEREIATGSVIEGVEWGAAGLVSSIDGRLVKLSANGQRAVLIDEASSRAKRPAWCGENGIAYRLETDGKPSPIWWCDTNGTSRRQLTRLYDADYPVCTADGRSVFYVDNETSTVHRVATSGGAAQDLGVKPAYQVAFAFSSDSKRMVYKVQEPQPPRRSSWRVVDVEPRTVIRDFPVVDSTHDQVVFTRDGTGFVYAAPQNGSDNLYLQPIDGSPGRFITASTDADPIIDVSISPDGKSAAVIRRRRAADMVLIHDSSR